MRGLALYGKMTGNKRALDAVRRAAEVFLKRHLFRRQSDGRVIRPAFTTLHYPPYWHYDILAGLKVMAEAGFIGDERCTDALDLLESKRLPDGGFPAEDKYYHLVEKLTSTGHRSSGFSLVGWGPTGKTRMNEFVTVDALAVLKAAGRL